MYPILLTTGLLLVAGTSAYMSIYGLMSVFVSHGSVVMCMGLGMEIGKILVVSHTYRNWQELNKLVRLSYVLIISVLVLLTSIEVAGFLSQSHMQATHDLRISETALNELGKEAAILRDQISVIDATLAGLPTSHVSRRIAERKISGYDRKQERLLEIAKEQAQLQNRIVREKQIAGPIFAISRIMKVSDTGAAAGLILLLVLVLEPLSIGLTVAACAAWTGRKRTPKAKTQQDTSKDEFISLQREYKLGIAQIMHITGRKKAKTCEAWLKGTEPVPRKAMRALRAWAKKQESEPARDDASQSASKKPKAAIIRKIHDLQT